MEHWRLAVLSSHLCPTPPSNSRSVSSSICGFGSGSSSENGDSEFCVFCKIVRGQSPSLMLYEDDICLCILDTHPLSHGHSLIIPKSHFSSLEVTPPSLQHNDSNFLLKSSPTPGFSTLTVSRLDRAIISLFNHGLGGVKGRNQSSLSSICLAMEIFWLFWHSAAVPSNIIESWYHADSFNLLVNNGAAAGQVIFHTHIHIIPRKASDCLWTSESLRRRAIKLDQEAFQLVVRVHEQLSSLKNNEEGKDQGSSLTGE